MCGGIVLAKAVVDATGNTYIFYGTGVPGAYRARLDKVSPSGALVWTKLIEKRNVAAGFNLTLQEDPYLPTDTTPLPLFTARTARRYQRNGWSWTKRGPP